MANTKANSKNFIVKNRSTSRVIYSIPSLNIRRVFAPGESMKIGFEEFKKFMFEPGAKSLVENFLQVDTEDAIKEFNLNVQPEYFLDEQQVKDLLLTGSLDAFLDCLDFAPVGVIDLVKAYSVSLPLSDYNKRKALKEKIGFDVDKALLNKELEKAEESNGSNTILKTNEKERPKATVPTRRTNANYNKIVNN